MVPGGERGVLVKPVIVEPLLSHRIAAVACGWAHTACITDRGKLITFGSNAFGALGHGLTDEERSHVPPRAVPALAAFDVVQVPHCPVPARGTSAGARGGGADWAGLG